MNTSQDLDETNPLRTYLTSASAFTAATRSARRVPVP